MPFNARSLRVTPERRDVHRIRAQGIYPFLGRRLQIQRSRLPPLTIRAPRVDDHGAIIIARETGTGQDLNVQ